MPQCISAHVQRHCTSDSGQWPATLLCHRHCCVLQANNGTDSKRPSNVNLFLPLPSPSPPPPHPISRLLYLQDIYTHRHQEPQSKAQSSTLARRPDPAWAYAVLLSLLLGMLSLWTTRFQYLWVPCACSIAAAGVCHSKLWRDVSGAIGAKSSVVSL